MNMKKRLIALLMALAMVLAYMPALAFADDGEWAVDDPIAFIAPTSAEPITGGLSEAYGDIGTDNVKYAGHYGFAVTYSTGEVINFFYQTGTYTGSDGKEHIFEGFFREGAEDLSLEENYLEVSVDESEKVPSFKKGWNKGVEMILNAPCWTITGSAQEQSYYGGLNISASIDVWCNYRVPVSAEFKPADGFKVEGFVGYNFIDESYFYGEGNSFDVTYEYTKWDPDSQTYMTLPDTVTYTYAQTEDGDEGFYEAWNENPERLSLAEDPVEVILKKGNNKVKIPFYAYATGSDDPEELSFDVNVSATRYNAYANWPIFDYTGKYISKTAFAKKLKVKVNGNDKLIPASEYTFSWKKQKKIGWYEVTIKFKDKNKYVDSITAEYGIGPKTPTINKIRGGKKKLIITWKKFTKSQLKNIDGLYIEVAQNKNFTKGYKIVKVSKKAMKKNYYAFKKLAGKKKYYVRMSTFKKIKQGGVSYEMPSRDSKVKTGKTKK